MQRLILGIAFMIGIGPSAFGRSELSKSELNQRAEAYRRYVLESLSNIGRNASEDPVAMMVSGIFALYADQQRPISAELRQRLDRLRIGDPERTLEFALWNLGDQPSLTFGRAVVVTVNGLRTKTDPTAGLVFQDMLISSPAGLSIGIELEGLTLTDRIIHHVDILNLAGVNRAGSVRPPVGPIWRISRVTAGSPAAEAGLVPGDRIVRIDEELIDRTNHAALFARLAQGSFAGVRDPVTGLMIRSSIRLTVIGAEGKSITAVLTASGFTPRVFHPVSRSPRGEPDYWLDRAAKIACIRVGAVELNSEPELIEILDDLRKQGVRGLLLDLRWCPGGYVAPTIALASRFLAGGTEIAKQQPVTEGPVKPERQQDVSSGPTHDTWLTLPLAVLVNGETIGGSEMVAASLQDHKRAVIIGQRTFGKANIMTANPSGLPGLNYRATTAYMLRPNGLMRHRFPDSKRDDAWGVTPNRGFEVPTTPELALTLRLQHEAQSVRRAADRTALAADDVAEDAQRLTALKLFRQTLNERSSPNSP